VQNSNFKINCYSGGAREIKIGSRTLKDCKKELKKDRVANAKKRQSKDKKRKSRTRQQPEVVVVYKYPKKAYQNTVSSIEQT